LVCWTAVAADLAEEANLEAAAQVCNAWGAVRPPLLLLFAIPTLFPVCCCCCCC
jgi:hypothetical protein